MNFSYMSQIVTNCDKLWLTISMFRGIPLSTFNINIYWYETSPIFLNNNYWFNSGLKCLLSQIRQVPAVPTRGKQWWSWNNGNWSSVWKVSNPICLMPTANQFPRQEGKTLGCLHGASVVSSLVFLSIRFFFLNHLALLFWSLDVLRDSRVIRNWNRIKRRCFGSSIGSS